MTCNDMKYVYRKRLIHSNSQFIFTIFNYFSIDPFLSHVSLFSRYLNYYLKDYFR